MNLRKENPPSVVLINGSPHENGNTARAIAEIEAALHDEGVLTKRIWIGKMARGGCIACGGCKKDGKCIFDDVACDIADALESSDGIIIASPVYYASPNGSLIGILDRVFHSSKFDKWMKVGASVAVARRGGTSTTFDVINKYFTISEMPVVSSVYWNQIHGASIGDADEDLEGLQTLRVLGRNTAYLVKCIRLGSEQLSRPTVEDKIRTSFVR